MSAVFPFRGGEKQASAGYGFSVSPKGVQLVAGSYMPGPEHLAAVRTWLDKRHGELRKVLAAPALVTAWGELRGERLQRVPCGLDREHPASDLLRLKQYYLQASLPAGAAAQTDLPEVIAERFRAAAPFVKLLDRVLQGRG
jgi:hypothetical protein